MRPSVESELSAHAVGCVLVDCRATCGTARGVADAPKAGDADAGSADERARLDQRVAELAGEVERVRAERDGAWGLVRAGLAGGMKLGYSVGYRVTCACAGCSFEAHGGCGRRGEYSCQSLERVFCCSIGLNMPM